MTREEVLSSLCTYDTRNPEHNPYIEDVDDMGPHPREDCYCDQCFYGKAKFAEFILQIEQRVSERLSLVLEDLEQLKNDKNIDATIENVLLAKNFFNQ